MTTARLRGCAWVFEAYVRAPITQIKHIHKWPYPPLTQQSPSTTEGNKNGRNAEAAWRDRTFAKSISRTTCVCKSCKRGITVRIALVPELLKQTWNPSLKLDKWNLSFLRSATQGAVNQNLKSHSCSLQGGAVTKLVLLQGRINLLHSTGVLNYITVSSAMHQALQSSEAMRPTLATCLLESLPKPNCRWWCPQLHNLEPLEPSQLCFGKVCLWSLYSVVALLTQLGRTWQSLGGHQKLQRQGDGPMFMSSDGRIESNHILGRFWCFRKRQTSNGWKESCHILTLNDPKFHAKKLIPTCEGACLRKESELFARNFWIGRPQWARWM